MADNTNISFLGLDFAFFGFCDKDLEPIFAAEEIWKSDSPHPFKKTFSPWIEWCKSEKLLEQTIVVYNPVSSSSQEEETNISELIRFLQISYTPGSTLLNNEVKSILDVQKLFLSADPIPMGMQYPLGQTCFSSCGRAIKTILFIDKKQIQKKLPEYLVPIILHEITHYLEEISLGFESTFGSAEILKALSSYDNNVKEAESLIQKLAEKDIWNITSPADHEKKHEWDDILKEQAAYQAHPELEHERMTTLVERMAVGSLYDVMNQEMLQTHLTVFLLALKEHNIFVTEA